MRKFLFYLVLPTLFTLGACNEKPQADESNSSVTEEEIIKAEAIEPTGPEDKVIYLQGIYATSTALPLNINSIENVLDGNNETLWKTMPGAGPDEGFMFYFENPLFVNQVSLQTDSGSAALKTVTVYADGKNLGEFEATKEITVNNEIRSLFVRVKKTSDIETESNTGSGLYIEKFNKEKSVTITDIKITGKDGQAYKISAPKKVKGDILASSTLKPELSYHVNQLFDSRKEFVWAEGAAGGGENETLQFNTEQPITIHSIQLWNGFQRSDKHYSENARVKKFEFGKEGSTAVYELADTKEPQRITLQSPVNSNKIIFKVLEVYPGKTYKDLVISELRFYEDNVPVVIENKTADSNIEALQNKVKGTVLEEYLDKRIKFSEEGPYANDYSIILRSDNTFVAYSLEEESEDTKEIIADGGWELLELNGAEAKIRVFGKLLDLSQTLDYYKGTTSTSSFLRIFQDKVTITKDVLKGEKFIQTYYNHVPEGE